MKFLILLTFVFAAPAYGRRVEMTGDDVMYAAGSALECDLCEMFVGDLQKALQSKENEIMDAADELCASAPTIFGRNCSAIMDEVIAILFQVVEDLTPNEICQEIQLCDAIEELRPPRRSQRTFVRMMKFMMQKAASRNQMQKRRMIRYLRQTVGDDYQCEFCKGVVGFLYDAVTCNETLAEIVNLLIPTCDLCPKKPECIKYFQKLPELAKAFADKFLNSEEDCALLGLCPEEEFDDAWMWEGFWEDGDEVEEEERLEEEEEELLDMVEETEDLEDEILDQLRMKKKKAFWRRYRSQASQNAWAKKAAALRKMNRPKRSPFNAIEVVLGDTIEEAGIPYEVSNNMQLPEGVTCDLCDSLVLIRNECLNHHEENFYNTFTTYFTDLCEKLPGSWRAECTEDIAQEVPRLLYEMFRNIMQPRSVCGEILEVCSVDQAEELV